MFSLLLAMLCSASIALLFKVSESGGFNRARVTTANYVAAFTFSLILFIGKAFSGGSSVASLFHGVSWPSVIGLGIPAGFCFLGSFLLYQQSVKDNGASLSSMAGKMGILLPMIASIVLWREWPSPLQMVGIALAIGAIVYLNLNLNLNLELDGQKKPSTGARGGLKLSLIFLFLVGGLGEFSNKLFQVYGHQNDQSLFLFVVFATACILSLAYAFKQKPLPNTSLGKDVLMGLAIGIPNLLSSHFLIKALGTMPAAIAFPAFSAGTILVVTVLSRLLFKEMLSKRSALGLAMTTIALILIF